jgi:hypothetical protein
MPKMGMQHKTVKKQARRHLARRRAPTGLGDAFFSKTQLKVLALLFGQPDRSFFATELITLTKSGSGAVQRELSRLAESGLVNVTRVGNQKHFQANPTAPLFGELRSIVRKTVGPIEPLNAALALLANRIALALVYGSVAKRTDTAANGQERLTDAATESLTLSS